MIEKIETSVEENKLSLFVADEKKRTFDQFTRRYALSRTLSFGLRPVGNTQQMLVDRGIIEMDRQRKEAYEKTKPFFDRLHQEFIGEALQSVALKSVEGYRELYDEWKKDNKNNVLRKKVEDREKKIREEIVALFDAKASEWSRYFSEDAKIKKENHEFLFESSVFSILRKKYGDDAGAMIDGVSIFDSWDKWSGYFKKFFETRKNFYKSDGTSTAVATRIVNDNLRRFCDNLKIFEVISKEIDVTKLQSELNVNLTEVFQLDFYNSCLSQSGIDQYNMIIGGKTLENGKKIQGINEYINEYRQKTKQKLPRFKQLDKQIGSDRISVVDIIDNDIELKDVLLAFVRDAKEKMYGDVNRSSKGFNDCIQYLLSEKEIDFSKVYFRKEAINTITRRWFADSEKISLALIDALREFGYKSAKFDKKKEEYRFPDFVSWQAIQYAVGLVARGGERIWKEHFYNDIPSLDEKEPWNQFLAIFQLEYDALLNRGGKTDGERFEDLRAQLERLIIKDTLGKSDETTAIIKVFADRVLNVYQFAKYFSLEKSRQWNPDGLETDDFYTMYEQFYSDTYEKIVKTYNKIRNYVTKKPFGQNKWVLNFENPTLADGWDKNKETDNTAIILRKDKRYYLGIMDKENRKIFENIPESGLGKGYEKMVYKLFPDPAKMMPKVCFSKKGRENFDIPTDVLRIYENNEFKKGDTFSVSSMQRLISFYNKALTEYPGWKMYDFAHVKDPEMYIENIGEYYRDVAIGGYKIFFENISEEYIDSLNQQGKLYLFEIHNKDWNLKGGKEKTGTKNLQTLYFEQVFSNENVQNNFVVKLNGEAELFFRPATEKEKLGYKAKYSGKWYKVEKEEGKYILINKDGQRLKIEKDKVELRTNAYRYAKDKMFFHVPITFNRTAPEVRQFDKSINEFLADNPDINIIGIDRGEKHLAYLSVINQKGEILEIKSLNKINGIDYAQLLEARAKNREQARRDWKSVEQIKDLKKGYISNVVREIADLIIKYNAIVVFEDLNMRFKQVRGGIEKSVYQQLEKALIEKLNFLVDKKEMNPEKAGHVLRAYQLTAPFTTFKEMRKQTGVLFYTQAEYTSQTDPVTGFRKNVYISNSATTDSIKQAIEKFDVIGWDNEKNSYYFEYNPVSFVDKKFKDNVVSKLWRVYANVPRIKRERQKDGYWETLPINPNEKLQELFELWNFEDLKGDIKKQIFDMQGRGALEGTKEFDGKRRNFWQSFVYLFNLVLQVRNSTSTQHKRDEDGNILKTIEGVDFISSPVEPFFCTDGGMYTKGWVDMAGMETMFIGSDEDRKRFAKEFNGDANGAYNIARKGIILLERISKEQKNPKLFISKKDWDEFAQKR